MKKVVILLFTLFSLQTLAADKINAKEPVSIQVFKMPVIKKDVPRFSLIHNYTIQPAQSLSDNINAILPVIEKVDKDFLIGIYQVEKVLSQAV